MGGGERDPVSSSKTWASPVQGAHPSLRVAHVPGWYVDDLLIRDHELVPVLYVFGVGIPYRPISW